MATIRGRFKISDPEVWAKLKDQDHVVDIMRRPGDVPPDDGYEYVNNIGNLAHFLRAKPNSPMNVAVSTYFGPEPFLSDPCLQFVFTEDESAPIMKLVKTGFIFKQDEEFPDSFVQDLAGVGLVATLDVAKKSSKQALAVLSNVMNVPMSTYVAKEVLRKYAQCVANQPPKTWSDIVHMVVNIFKNTGEVDRGDSNPSSAVQFAGL